MERNNPQNVTYYQYDNQGNTISELTKRYLKPETTKVQNGGTTTITNRMAQTEVEQYKTYEYDSFNKTARVVVEDYLSQNTEGHSITTGKEAKAGKTVHIQQNYYDAEDLRYGIEEDGERTNFVTNGWSVFTELDAEWKPTKRLVRGYGIVASEELKESVGTDIPNEESYHYYHLNEHGDIKYITGRDGTVNNAYTYDAFGSITNAEELVKNHYTYNGEQYDQITQQYYLRARNYNPLIGRFTQEDVYRGDGLNLYAYCGNNPVMYVDPSGYYKATDEVFDESSVGKNSRSQDLKAAMISDMTGMPYSDAKGVATGSYQAQHIIPKEHRKHPVIQATGYQVDHAENGIFAINRVYEDPNVLSVSLSTYQISASPKQKYITDATQHGRFGNISVNHEAYNEYVEKQLDSIGKKYGLVSGMSADDMADKIKNVRQQSDAIEDLKTSVMDLNSKLRKAHQDGIDLYLRNDYNTKTKDYYAGGKNKEQAKYEEDNFGDKCLR